MGQYYCITEGVMRSFHLDKMIGIWISFPFRWLLESPEAKLNAQKKLHILSRQEKFPLKTLHEWYEEFYVVS